MAIMMMTRAIMVMTIMVVMILMTMDDKIMIIRICDQYTCCKNLLQTSDKLLIQ